MLNERIDEERLIVWTPSIEGDRHVRSLFITDRLNDQFDQDYWQDVGDAHRFGQLNADFDRFVTGDTIPVGWHPFDKGDNAFIARIDPVEYGVWDIRSLAPSPAIRVFGAFYKTDVFIALDAKFRQDLGGKNDPRWANARENAIAIWNDLLPDREMLKGGSVDDFISEKKIVV